MSVIVSVIIPCYNHAHYLPVALNSVLAQTCTDWEAIIVDDGSTDNTRAVAAQFTDPRIHYLHQENQGLSAARNAGIRAAQGPYLAFLDADDEWASSFLERSINIMRVQEQEVAGVVTGNLFIDPEGNALPRAGGQGVTLQQFPIRLLEGGFFPVHSALVRTDCVQEAGLFDEGLTSLEDWDLWLRIVKRGYTFQSVSEPLARYRVYPGSMSTNAARMHANRVAVLTKHFGPPEGDPAQWGEEKRRAYGFGYRSGAYDYIGQGHSDEGWQLLAHGVALWPDLLQRLDTFYELACGDQPKGYRGEVRSLDIERNGVELLHRLEELFAAAGAPVQTLRGVAYGNACLALAMLSDQAGEWAAARRHLLKAIGAHPALFFQSGVARRLFKLFLGQRVVSVLRERRASLATPRQPESGA